MKALYSLIFFLITTLLISINASAQNQPVWVRQLIATPDTTVTVYPKRTITSDNSLSVYVLSTLNKNGGPWVYKIQLDKYSRNGTRIWSLVYDNNGVGNPYGSDLAIDDTGNCYIAGSITLNNINRPMLLRVDSNRGVHWMVDSTTAFNTGGLSTVIFKNNRLLVAGSSGIASFDLKGNEIWSKIFAYPSAMTVDNKTRMVVSAGNPAPKDFFRYKANGQLDFSDSTIAADRITTDYYNNIYLFEEQATTYQLVKYDSSGIFQWSTTNLPPPPAFPIPNFNLVADYNSNVWVVGINDSLFKFSESGTRLFGKPLGLKVNNIISTLTENNVLAVAGTLIPPDGYGTVIYLFDQNGNRPWQGNYIGPDSGWEYTTDMAYGYTGLYGLISDKNYQATLIKFANPFLNRADYSLVCVDSVWYAPNSNNHIVNVRVFNGSLGQLNYPSVQGVSPAGDTVINPKNTVDFFAQADNSYTTYYDSITTGGINNFSNFTFLISEGFGDTTAVIKWCNTITWVPETAGNEMNIYPNPAGNQLIVVGSELLDTNGEIYVIDMLGRNLLMQKVISNVTTIDVSHLAVGVYFVALQNGNERVVKKVVKQ